LRTAVAGELLYQAIRLFSATTDFRSEGDDAVLTWKQRGRPLVFLGWHGNDAVNLAAYRLTFGQHARGAIMVVDTPGGHIVRHVGRGLGLRVELLGPDPQSPQWRRGVVEMIRLIRQGYDTMLAVDGPRGPAHSVKLGPLVLAQRAGAGLVPCATASSRAVRLKWRWDNHIVPFPFCQTVAHFGSIIDTRPASGKVPSVEELQIRVAQALAVGDRRAAELCHAR
jgi:lysophospholipid acyltransferase (LPLAT)-like uncharacterized protein